jgi:hypothetical protein
VFFLPFHAIRPMMESEKEEGEDMMEIRYQTHHRKVHAWKDLPNHRRMHMHVFNMITFATSYLLSIQVLF